MDLTSCSIDWLHYARLTLAGQQKPPSGLHNLRYPEWIFTTQKPFPIISNSIIVVRPRFTRNVASPVISRIGINRYGSRVAFRTLQTP